MPSNVQTRQRRNLLQEVFMDKPFGIVMIGLAIFVTLGALATSSLTPSDARSETTEQAATNRAAASGASNSEIERGKYLVEEVAKCPECHTPRNESGELKRDAWLRGAPIWIKPVAPIAYWA